MSNTATVTLTDWKLANGTEYCPLVVSVNGTDIKCTGTVADFENAIEAAIENYKADYAPGTDLSTKDDACPVVTWKWAYEGNNDANDTALGDAANEGKAPKIAVTITTTVTQID